MGAVSNVTTLANSGSTVNRVLSARIAPEFSKNNIMMPLIASEDLPENSGTLTKGFQRDSHTGSAVQLMSATSTLAEATAQALQTSRVDTVVDLTAAKAVRCDGVSLENQKFGIKGLYSYLASQGSAISRAVDNQVLALFSSFTDQVDAVGPLTIDDLDDAELIVRENEVPNADMPLVFVGALQAVRELKGELRNSSASAINSERFLSIFDGPPRQNGYFGSLPGYELYTTSSGFATDTGRNIQAMFHPSWAIAGMFDRSIATRVTEKGSEGLYTELVSYYFWSCGIWCDEAGCEVLSTV